MNSRLLRSLKIQAGEGTRVVLMFIYSLAAVGGGVVLGRALSRSLFLSTLPETAVPYKFILPPFFVIIGTLVYNRLVPHYKMYRLISATNLMVISGLLILRYFLDSPFATTFPFLAALYIYFEVIVTTVGIQFWTFAGEVFNPREAKRLFGLIAAGGVLSNAIIGFGLRALSNKVLPKDLIFIVAGSLLIGIICVWILGKLKEKTASDDAQSLPQRSDTTSISTRKDLREIFSQPMLVTIGGLMVITSLVTNITDFQLDLSLQRFFAHDGQGMLSFLGTFQIFIGIVAVLAQLLLTNRILERLGLTAGLLLLPFAVGGGSLALIASVGAFWAMALPRGADMILRYTINDASLNVLFLPIPESFRKRVKSILDGVIKPPLMALLGLAFLLLLRDDIDQVGVQAGDILPWSYVVLVLIALWMFLVLRTRKQYELALVKSLKGHRLGFEHTQFDVKDETSVALITQELKNESSNPLRMINIIEMLKSSEETGWHPYIAQLLNHKSADVRELAAHYFEQRAMLIRDSQVLDDLKKMMSDNEPKVSSAAIKAYCALLGDASLEETTPLLSEADLSTRQAAIVGLMKYAGLSGVLESAAVLKQMFSSEDPNERQAGAAILGSLQTPSYYHPLLPLLDDPDETVQQQAIFSAGKLKHVALLPKLTEKLGDARQNRNTISALALYGTKAEPQLATVIAESSNKQKRLAAIKTLRLITTQSSAQILTKHFNDSDDHIRAAVAKALASLQRNGVRLTIDRAELLQTALDEIKRTYSIRIAQADIGRQSGQLLGRALQDHLGFVTDHLFSLLSLLYPERDMQSIYKALTTSGRQRSNALELIDTMADKEIRDVMLPLVEDALPERIAQIAEKRFGLQRNGVEAGLIELTQSKDPIMRAFAIYQLGVLGFASISRVIRENLDHKHFFVQEAVVWAITFASTDEELQPLLEHQTRSSFESVRDYAKRTLQEVSK
ncbi:MAG TPA: Npt1/Npt2 family nucleotide transporter [Anaerolineales bacterium]|nr:Npt1/Npt2 family nucleotide transporter [Anaerolineales bacterium]